MRIISLVRRDGVRLTVDKRTAAVILQVYELQERIEACQKGSIEITINFKNRSVSATVREIGETSKLE